MSGFIFKEIIYRLDDKWLLSQALLTTGMPAAD